MPGSAPVGVEGTRVWLSALGDVFGLPAKRVEAAGSTILPALYFTNLISARPLIGSAGAGSLAQVVNAAIANRDRMERRRDFLDGVGTGDTAGIWEGAPRKEVGPPGARRQSAGNLRGPLARAWTEADRITPLIFSR